MACLTENQLLEYADGLLDADRARKVLDHVQGCDTCRKVLAAIAMVGPDEVATHAEISAPAAAQPTGELPAELLDRYLRKDEREREMTASLVVLVLSVLGALLVAVVSLALPESPRPGVALVVQPLVIAYEAALYARLRRGWFHPAVPLVSSLVEVSVGFAILLGMASHQPDEALTTPFHMLVALVVLFTAIRFDPRICLAAGAVAAAEEVALLAYARSVGLASLPVSALTIPGGILRAGFVLAAGCAGAVLARHVRTRAQAALREMREQDLFGKYLLHERLGDGGMGEVLRATYCPEGGFVRTVAVKRMHARLAADVRLTNAFREEAMLSAHLVHPNLVQVLDCGRFRGDFVFAMEFVDGSSLARVLERAGALPPRAVAYLAAELAAGLAYLHGRLDEHGHPLGLVHLDLNPPNVMVSTIGEVKITDFGVARATRRGAPHEGFSGKLRYAAPEQLLERPLDARADLFALGLTLHEACTGQRVFDRNNENALTAPVADLRELRPDLPPALSDLIMDLLAEDPAARPADAGAVRARLLEAGPDLAPYPAGAALLTEAVQAARRIGARNGAASVS